jgi:hypothetical protein
MGKLNKGRGSTSKMDFRRFSEVQLTYMAGNWCWLTASIPAGPADQGLLHWSFLETTGLAPRKVAES